MAVFKTENFCICMKKKRMISSRFTCIWALGQEQGDAEFHQEWTVDFRGALNAKNENEASMSVSSSTKIRWGWLPFTYTKA